MVTGELVLYTNILVATCIDIHAIHVWLDSSLEELEIESFYIASSITFYLVSTNVTTVID